jgi:hypothetical protein
VRIVALLTRMAIPFEGVAEAENEYARGIEQEDEDDSEHDSEHGEEPERSDADDGLDRPFLKVRKFSGLEARHNLCRWCEPPAVRKTTFQA